MKGIVGSLCVIPALVYVCVLFIPVHAFALSLSYVSDLVGTSRPSATTTHTIQFRATQAIPASGSFTVTPQSGSLTIPASFDYTDVDVATSSTLSGVYNDRNIGTTANASQDGVSVATGSSGSITITLSSSAGISAGEYVQVELGTHATHATSGDQLLVNASSAGSYGVTIATFNASGGALDNAKTMVVMIQPVILTAVNQNSPPVISGGLPTSTIAADNETIEISVETDEYATCKYATTTGVVYDSMPFTFTTVTNYLFYSTVTGHVNEATYNYYVRCRDIYGTVNESDYILSFTIDEEPISNTSVFIGGDSGNGGVGPFPGGSSFLYLASVRLIGYSSPQSTVTVLRDGKTIGTTRAGNDGKFDATVTGMERGTYTFQLYGTDRARRKSSSYGATISVVQGTTNVISNITTPPTIALSDDTLELNSDAIIEGEAVPGSTVEMHLYQGSSTVSKKYTTIAPKSATSTENGAWSITIPSRDLAKGVYVVRARAIVSAQLRSALSDSLVLRVGETGPNTGNRSDINRDGKVNLIDFSIMLSHWGTSDDDADINQDGKIDLADFSIMLFNWTG